MGKSNEELKTELVDFLRRLEEKALLINGNLQTLKIIDECLRDDRVAMLRMFEGYFSLTIDALVSNIIVRTFNMYDESPRAQRGIPQFLTRARSDAHTLVPPQIGGHMLAPVLVSSKQDLIHMIDHQLQNIETAKPILEKIAIHRSKYRVHSDKKFFDDPNLLLGEYHLNIQDLDEIDALTRAILAKQHIIIIGSDWTPILAEGYDVVRLVEFLKRGHEALRNQSRPKL